MSFIVLFAEYQFYRLIFKQKFFHIVGSNIRRALELCPQIQLIDDKIREEFIILIPRRDTGANLDSSLDSRQ
jgi:hypothetical protein